MLKKAAYFAVSMELLHDVLMLPTDVQVTQMTWDHGRRAYVVSVIGPGLPDKCNIMEGGTAMEITPMYHQAADEVKIDLDYQPPSLDMGVYRCP